MTETVVLRFRDLVTEPGGTILEHRRIIETQGYVWWGWWGRQYEAQPRDLLRQLDTTLSGGVEPAAFLFDSGRQRLHACTIVDLRMAPPGETIGPPMLDAAPTYYQRGSYPAWFKLAHIEPVGVEEVPAGWRFAAFPTNPDLPEHVRLVGEPVASLEELRKTDATMWVVRAP